VKFYYENAGSILIFAGRHRAIAYNSLSEMSWDSGQ
jgi:hypothetical protein